MSRAAHSSRRRKLVAPARVALTRRERSVAQLRRLALRFPGIRVSIGEDCLGFEMLSDAFIGHLRQVLAGRLRLHRRAVRGALPAGLCLAVQGVDGEMTARERQRRAEASERLALAVADLARGAGTDKTEARAALRGDMDAYDALVATRRQRAAAEMLDTRLRDPAWRPTRADAAVALDGLIESVETLAEAALDARDRRQAEQAIGQARAA